MGRRLSGVALASALLASACGATLDADRAPSDAASRARDAELVRQLDALVKGFAGDAGIWIGDPTAKVPVYTHNADEKILAASLYKLAVLMEVERSVDRGTLKYSDLITVGPEDVTGEGSVYEAGAKVPLDEALEAMITVSDNGTALALWRLLGGANIDASLERDGIRDFITNVEGPSATPRAIATFFGLLARKELVSRAASERMLARLQRQTINDRIPASLPAGSTVAHKTGDLVGVTHDAGIVVTASGPRVVVVMTWNTDDGGATAFIARVAALAFEAAGPAPSRRP